MSGCDDRGDETNSFVGTSRYVWEAKSSGEHPRTQRRAMPNEDALGGSTSTVDTGVLNRAGYEPTQSSEKAETKRPETTDQADRSEDGTSPLARG